MPRIFYDFSGRPTGILRSSDFLSKSFKERERMAFDSTTYKNLSAVDRASLSGYATAVRQINQANNYRYRKAHPRYKRKTI